jgi:hypothetical protein
MAVLLFRVVLPARGQDGYIADVRGIETTDLGIASPVGLAYSPQAELFEIMARQANGADNPLVIEMNMYEDLAGQATIADRFSHPLNIAFNGWKNSLFHLNQNAVTLDEIPADANGRLPVLANVSARFNIREYGLRQARGITFNPADGTLYLLDPAGKRMIRVVPDGNGDYDGPRANREGRIQRIDLRHLGARTLNGIAFNPSSGHLFVLGPEEKMLFEITEAGQSIDTYDVSPYTLRDPGAMVFAPSGDNTDDPAIQDLFIADSGQAAGQASGPGQVLEFSLTPPELEALPPTSTDITRVQTINTSSWSPPSPDPAGLEFRTTTGKLLMSDSEVDEMSIWQGKNVFESSPAGGLTATCNVLNFSKEPAGVTENPDNRHVFISDDGKSMVFEIDLGPDNIYCTADDTRRSINTLAFNDVDPEALAFGQGKLIVTDGMGAEVYIIAPGTNQTFGDSDDQITHFDTMSMGIRDPEGIGYNAARDSLFITGRQDLVLIETTFSGTVLSVWDISTFSGVLHPSGLACGPGSQDQTKTSIYVSDRGVDNNDNPNENDGKIYEFEIGNTPPPAPTPTATSGPPPGPASLYLSFADGSSFTVGAVAGVRDEDILSFDGTNFAMFFDGSDVGVGVDVNAFHRVDSDTILLSFDNAVSLPGLGAVADTDVVQFEATSLGDTTAGTFSLYFNGADVGLDTSAEDIDGFGILPDGRLIFSTTGNPSVPGVSGRDEDILAFTPASLGSNTSGSWAMYFDGSDVGLAENSGEDIDGLDAAEDGKIYLSTRSIFSVPGVSGDNEDIFVCTPTSIGDTTACSYSGALYFDGSAFGVAALDVDGVDLP